MVETGEKRWEPSSRAASLSANHVDVWLANQEQGPEVVQSLREILSPDERSRADRFHFDRDRVHYIVCRGVLRNRLGEYVGTSPARVAFDYNKYGKPTLSKDFESSRISFNVSHSGGKALLAFSVGRELGVDIERIRPDFATGEIAERFFSPAEVSALTVLPENVRADAFFNCWTRKEAYIKAIGQGLSCPLDAFDVSLTPDASPELLATRVEQDRVERWSMKSLDCGPGFKGALLVEGNDWDLRLWQWP